MALVVEVISDEIVKPSSPTADGLRHRLSFLDQLTPSHYNQLVYFYPKIFETEADKIEISDRLKCSIFDAFVYFYPLAGGMTADQLFVECNNEGISFVEVRLKFQLSDVLNNPVPRELNKLLPFEIHGANEFFVGIQFNVFDCGGLAVCISHKAGDALSFFSFVKTWAAIARGETELITPDSESASLFPPPDLSAIKPITSQPKTEQIITKRFATRVEALSAFIWERFVTAMVARSKLDTAFTITHLVNIRPRIEPPFPESSFGKLYSRAMSIPSTDGNIVTQIRDSIKAVNNEYVEKLRDGYNHLDKFTEMETRHSEGQIVPFTVTSLRRFPRYEADFGRGKPLWAGSGDVGIKNLAIFMDDVNVARVGSYGRAPSSVWSMAFIAIDGMALGLVSNGDPSEATVGSLEIAEAAPHGCPRVSYPRVFIWKH
ncbi:hypothetical protein F3Y22_tig00112864pilonHSYRG00055 [Hibiscus syriacus]|uniref:Uncharacterized protein n=1 Tax=Hibiscus syriacus TaxID=106335 RepID=A0A6A2Y536_HIBSY|nr:hypothetical protein F3Y22_tig00112864pilonHSYRG00055 [Hibiscus syriacus]